MRLCTVMKEDKVHSQKSIWSELDSFFDAKIAIYISNAHVSKLAGDTLLGEGFSRISVFHDSNEFTEAVLSQKHDLIIIDLRIISKGRSGYDLIGEIRKNDVDVAIITVSNKYDDIKRKLEYDIHRHFRYPFPVESLIKASKKALGDKTNYEIGMQFFDALFGMQMCTHRDLHQRTFDHVIRTTKVYAKFLLFLNRRKLIQLNSWVFKNCLMASLVHDIGKLLVMQGVLYKDGRLSAFEYEQIKRHPWNSITALLGGHDIGFFATEGTPLHTVNGYNDKNLGVMVRNWILEEQNHESGVLGEVEKYFNELTAKPFIHSLNFDLLYIVFRHHDGLDEPYLGHHELSQFGEILGRVVMPNLSEESPLDVVTNALTICDMYDALLDMKRDYRKSSYSKFFSLILLYNETKHRMFFPFLYDEFVRFVYEFEDIGEGEPFEHEHDGSVALAAIKSIGDLFFVTRDQENDFNGFLLDNKRDIERYAPHGVSDNLLELHQRWIDYFDFQKNALMMTFLDELTKVGLLKKEIADFTLDEIKTLDMLYRFYYSYSSSYKQKKLIDYLVSTVIEPDLETESRERIAKLILDPSLKTKKDFERELIENGFTRRDLFATFHDYDEDTLINELNDYLRTQGVWADRIHPHL